ncbi:MAG: hypothetical protein ACREXY_10825, partial [Gammaproteobacteria bacterium]
MRQGEGRDDLYDIEESGSKIIGLDPDSPTAMQNRRQQQAEQEEHVIVAHPDVPHPLAAISHELLAAIKTGAFDRLGSVLGTEDGGVSLTETMRIQETPV